MDKENAFKLLEKESERNFRLYDESIYSGIKEQKKFWFLVGDILELYLTKLINSVFGKDFGKKNIENDNYKTID